MQVQNPLQIIQEGHRLALHLLVLLHSFKPPSPSPWSCSSCPGPVGEGKGFLWRMLSLSSRLHHLQSMRAGKKAEYARSVCMRAHTHTRRQAGWWPDGNGMQKARDREVGVLLSFLKKKKKNLPGKYVWSRSQALRRLETLSLPSAVSCTTSIHVSQSLAVSIAFFLVLCLSR